MSAVMRGAEDVIELLRMWRAGDHKAGEGFMMSPDPDELQARARLLQDAFDLGGPEIVCLCGSSRFIREMAVVAWELEKLGSIVLSCNLLPDDYPGVLPDHQAEAEGVKEEMDELHLRKIDLARRVLVIDVGGAAWNEGSTMEPYIGESTQSEIEYATRTGKPVEYLSKGPVS